jgi:phenylacetate-CoA ligase
MMDVAALLETGSDETLNSLTNTRYEVQRASRESLMKIQLEKLNRMLEVVLPVNHYYQEHFGCRHLQLNSIDDWAQFPVSRKSDWLSEKPDGVAIHHSFETSTYRRYHRTSGTKGRPMVILDTEEDWNWWTNTWQYVLDACSIDETDRIFMAFSFGPFIGFWSAHDACLRRGCMVIPGGGMSTIARIDLIEVAKPTVLFGTPSYALHLAQEALARGKPLCDSSIKKVFVAGEPGGSIPSVRKSLEELYQSEVIDHAGATEIGPWGFGSRDGKAIHVIESEFIAEYLPLENIQDSRLNPDWRELVLTSLGRTGAPVLRYRTGDIVHPVWDVSNSETSFVRLEGGILGRADDMFVIRGVNVFPSSIEAVVREFDSVREFRIMLVKNGSLDELRLCIESTADLRKALEESLQVQLGLRIPVELVPLGSLPPTEGKSRRVVRSSE